MRLTVKLKEQLKAIALLHPGVEVCGLVLKDQGIMQFRNISETPETHFKFDLEEWEAHKAEARAVFHFHWSEEQSGYLGEADIENSRFFKIPYLLYHTEFDSWDYFDPTAIHPYPLAGKFQKKNVDHYMNWRFEYGRSDCCTFARAVFRGLLSVPMRDFTRVNPDKMDGTKTLGDVLIKAGFVDVSRSVEEEGLNLYDVPLMALDRHEIGQHVGVIWSTNPTRMLHHPGGDRLSENVPYDGSWRRRTLRVFRHKGICGVAH